MALLCIACQPMWGTPRFGEDASWLPVQSFLTVARGLTPRVRSLKLPVRSTFYVVRSFPAGVRNLKTGNSA